MHVESHFGILVDFECGGGRTILAMVLVTSPKIVKGRNVLQGFFRGTLYCLMFVSQNGNKSKIERP